jgi:hypothetical protein
MSPAAAGLLRALLARAGKHRDQVLLSGIRSTEWQSLTFIGERHELELRVSGPEAALVARRITSGIEDAEFAIPGQIVAEIALASEPQQESDGSMCLHIEALTVAE